MSQITATYSPDDNKLRLWEVAPASDYRTLVRDPILGRGEYHGTCATCPKSRWLAAAMSDGVGLWDLDSGNPLAFLPLGVCNVLFEPSGALVTTTSAGLQRWPIAEDSGAGGLLKIGPPQKLPLPGSLR